MGLVFIDHIVAAIVGAAVLLMAFTLQIRRQDLAAEAAVMYAGKTSALETADWLRRDLQNLGWGVPPSGTTAEAPVHDGAGRTEQFVFWRKETDAGAVVRIVYELQSDGVVTVGGVADSVFRVVRCQTASAATGGCPAGTAPASPRLTAFRIDLLDAGAMPTAFASGAKLVRVAFASVPPFAERIRRPYLARQYFGTTLPLARRSGSE